MKHSLTLKTAAGIACMTFALAAGAQTAQQGAVALNDGLQTLNGNSQALNDGAANLKNGLDTLAAALGGVAGTGDAAALEALSLAFGLTPREAEVLYWVARGKTNRDIGDILGSSPATVKKHLEHVYEKLGVETRTAAASLALARSPMRPHGP